MGKNSQPTKLKVFRVGALRLKKIILAVLPGRLKNSLRGKALFNGRRHTSVAWLFIISTISCTIFRGGGNLIGGWGNQTLFFPQTSSLLRRSPTDGDAEIYVFLPPYAATGNRTAPPRGTFQGRSTDWATQPRQTKHILVWPIFVEIGSDKLDQLRLEAIKPVIGLYFSKICQPSKIRITAFQNHLKLETRSTFEKYA